MRHIFENEHVEIVYGTKADGNLRIHTGVSAFLKKLNISNIIMAEPGGRDIPFFNDMAFKNSLGSEIVYAHGMIASYNPTIPFSLGMPTADCPALIFVDTKNHTLGIIHLGWWQVYSDFIEKFITVWKKNTVFDPEYINVFIGPGICKTCFTFIGLKGWIRNILFKTSSLKKCVVKTNKTYSFDIEGAARYQLIHAGLKDDHITSQHVCSYEDGELSSHRRERAQRNSSNFVVIHTKQNPPR